MCMIHDFANLNSRKRCNWTPRGRMYCARRPLACYVHDTRVYHAHSKPKACGHNTCVHEASSYISFCCSNLRSLSVKENVTKRS
nr:MAG TPA: hypothetical protein [Caudoviricetes sp.]